MAEIEKDISDDIDLKNRKANPFGWSTSEIWHGDAHVGDIYCGDFINMVNGYRVELVKETPERTRAIIFCKQDSEWWEAFEFSLKLSKI